jgi:hypothetical protein
MLQVENYTVGTSLTIALKDSSSSFSSLINNRTTIIEKYMLYRNGENLKDELISYLSNKKSITILSPYIKEKTLREILSSPGLHCEQIIVRWEPKDLAMGASDIEVYSLCKENNIALYINNRIHLKLFTNNFSDAFLGSANISERAISNNENNYNYEICSYVDSINRDDRLYLHRIINESIFVTDEIFNTIKSQIPDISPEIKDKSFKLPSTSNEVSDFLITKLPMIDNPILLWELYSGKSVIKSQEQENCYCHDIILYQISDNIRDENSFYKKLTTSFFAQPFIKSFLKEIDLSERTTRHGEVRDGLQFGAVRKWFSYNTTTVPSPRPFELTRNVKILYAWIEYLSNGKYSVSIPGQHSQVIKRTN